MLVHVLRDLGAEAQAGQKEGQEVADRGQAGAEDGAVDFHHGPYRRVGAVPGGIVGVDNKTEGCCTDDRNDAGAYHIVSGSIIMLGYVMVCIELCESGL